MAVGATVHDAAGHTQNHSAIHRGSWWTALVVILMSLATTAAAREPLPVFGPRLADTPVTTFTRHGDETAPASFAALPAWLAQHQKLPAIDMQGGNYWLVTRFRHDDPDTRWTVTFANTWYRHATLVILGDDGSRQSFRITRVGDGSLIAYRGVEAHLSPEHDYAILVAVDNPFFTSLPRIDVEPTAAHQTRTANETVITLATLGLLFGLGVFILFIGLWVGDTSYKLYGIQAFMLTSGWALYFGLPTAWLGWQPGWFNFNVFFIALPAVHAPFTIKFLNLSRHAPRFARIGYALAVVSIVCLPIAWIWPSISFFIANTMVTLAVSFSTSAGIWALTRGIREARFFTLAFMGVLIPGIVILPANFGMIPDLVDNADLLTLLGVGLEGMLLAFALADYVKLLIDARERFRHGMQDAIAQASVDPLTGIGNRLAFNVMVEEISSRPDADPLPGTLQIVMIDVDGLKSVNDNMGHTRGDDLLRTTGSGLAHLCSSTVRAFRLGGDEFALVAWGDDLSLQRLTKALAALDRGLRLRGFPGAGLSYGSAAAPRSRRRLSNADVAALVRAADANMYQQKAHRHLLRANSMPVQ